MIIIAYLKDYIWLFPLIAGILTIIGLFTPSSYLNLLGIKEYYWMWGLIFLDTGPYGSSTIWFYEIEPTQVTIFIFLQKFIHFIVLFIFASWICITAYKAAKEGDTNKYELFWIILGICLIIMAISYIIEMEIMMNYYFDEFRSLELSYWKTRDPGFAIIAPFISGGLSITGAFLSKYLRKRGFEVIIEKK
ncbi:MAG: hypothetical protein ACFE9T_05265 [Promethearchaeota archaeon]